MGWIRRNERGTSGTVTAADIIDTQAGTVTPETNGTAGQSRAMTGAETAAYALLPRDRPRLIEARGYGHDLTKHFADVIDDCLGRTDPTSGTRLARYPIELGPGVFEVRGDASTTPITVASAQGFDLHGSGMAMTTIAPVGTSIPAIMDLNGLSRSKVGGFTISSANTTTCTIGLWLRWGSGMIRSTNYDVIEDVAVEQLKFVEGIRLGEEGRNNQVDTSKMYNCHVKGQWTDGETTWWQSGIVVGHGVSANNLNHTAYGCSFSSCARGMDMRRSQWALFGGEFTSNGADIWISGHTHYLRVCEVRSEGSQRLLDGVGFTNSSSVVIEDYDWHANAIHSDGLYVKFFHGGSLTMRNVRVAYATADTVRPKIHLMPKKPLSLWLENHHQFSPVGEWLDIRTNFSTTTVQGTGWIECNYAGQPTRVIGTVVNLNGAPAEVTVDANGFLKATLIV